MPATIKADDNATAFILKVSLSRSQNTIKVPIASATCTAITGFHPITTDLEMLAAAVIGTRKTITISILFIT